MERCYIILENWHVIHITIFQLFRELDVKSIVLIFVLFGKEYAQISFPFQIMFADKSLTVERSIQIMLLLHQLMRYKESLIFLLAGSTLQCMIMEFMISSASPSSRSSSVRSLKWIWRYVEDIFQILCLSYLEGGFSPCGFAYFHSFLDIIIVKGWPYPCCWDLYASIFLTYHHKVILKMGRWDIIKSTHNLG